MHSNKIETDYLKREEYNELEYNSRYLTFHGEIKHAALRVHVSLKFINAIR